MRQIILSTQGAIVARVPRPSVTDGAVLVRVHYSLISTGTELAPLRASAELESANPQEGYRSWIFHKAPYYASKAIQNPHLAWRKAKTYSAGKALGLKQRLFPPSPNVSLGHGHSQPSDTLQPSLNEPSYPEWHSETATSISSEREHLQFQTNGKSGVYQVISQPIAIPDGHILAIQVNGRIEGGAVILGALSGDRTKWLSQRVIEDDFKEEIKIEANGDLFCWLVWSQIEEDTEHSSGISVKIDNLSVALEKHSKNAPRLNEMNDMGWGVGYSAAGEVIAVGDGVRDIKVGDFVACSGAGQANHAEFINVKQNLVARIPKGCPIDLAATSTVGTIALQGIRRAAPSLGETFCVVGLGLIGLMTLQMLKANGCKVLGIDPDAERAARAKQLGADHATTDPEHFLELTLHSTAGHGADATIITAAAKSDALINNAMKTTRRKGRVVVVGDIGLAMERQELYKKEIDVLISSSYGPGRYDPSYENDGIDYPFAYVRWTQNRNMQAYLELLSSGNIDIRALVDEVIPISNAREAYESLASANKTPPIGVLISYEKEEVLSTQLKVDTQIRLGGHRGAKLNHIGYVLVGAGAFGTSMLVPQMDKRKDLFDLRGVVSLDAVRGGNFARQRQLEILASDLDEVLKRDDIDLVVISTRHNQHANQVVEALNAGKHVFVEKPLALTWDELDMVRQAYESRPSPSLLMVGFNRRFAPAALALRKVVADRIAPMIINYRLNGGFIPRESWIQGKEGGGRNLGEACHMYDFFRALTGSQLTSISATAIDPMNSDFFVNDNFCATLTYSDGSLANLIYTANGPKRGLAKERVEVFCDGRAYILDNFTALREYPSETDIWKSESSDKGHFEELSQFGDAIANGASDGPIPIDEIFETTAASLHIEDLLQGRL